MVSLLVSLTSSPVLLSKKEFPGSCTEQQRPPNRSQRLNWASGWFNNPSSSIAVICTLSVKTSRGKQTFFFLLGCRCYYFRAKANNDIYKAKSDKTTQFSKHCTVAINAAFPLSQNTPGSSREQPVTIISPLLSYAEDPI